MDDLVLARLRGMIAEHEAEQAAMRADKPNVTDGHSDGKRVRYVRHEQSIATLREVIAMLEASPSATFGAVDALFDF